MRNISNRSIMGMLMVALVLTMAGTMLGLNRLGGADPAVLSGAATAEGGAGEEVGAGEWISSSANKLNERYSLLWWVLGGVIIALLAVIALWCYLPAGDYE
ncbi:MAG: hypothetical protein AABY26_04815 [Nanoarchaeota archaeon]